MTISGYSNAFVDIMLGWLKGFANWVLRLFNLAGSASASPLLWLSNNWLRLLVFFLIVGVAADLLVWIVRWRPHWVWFRKERVIVNDEKFFDRDLSESEEGWEEDDLLDGNWEERNYVVQSARRREKPAPTRAHAPASKQRGKAAVPARRTRKGAQTPPRRVRRPNPDAEGAGDLFGVDRERPGTSDYYEDEVFNVNSLPDPGEFSEDDE